jgi:putative colanic acid biosysnthesis UDP-glucose lipid carrier transferase
LNSATKHTAIQSLPISQWQHTHQNGIIRSFVASRKKYLITKRTFDILFSSLVVLFILSWLTPLVAMLIKLGSPGPIFFRQKRIGKNGVPFYCLKFRTMLLNDEADEMPAAKNDERITKAGRFLRHTNIDELPQFFNVLLGHMSVIGPRPHMVADCIRFSFVISSYSFRHLLRPGITGWAQVNGFHGPTSDYESIIIRYYWDAMYVRKAGVLLDIKIFWKTLVQGVMNTVWRVFRK